jgi:hypothetical protein
MKQMKTKSRQQLWQEKQIAEKRCASCASQDKETLSGSRRCAKCKSKGRRCCRQNKRNELGCNPWVAGGRGRPPVNKKEVCAEMKEMIHINSIARDIAAIAHAGQKRRGGVDYIVHCDRVAAKVPTRLKAVAFLHDVREDNPQVENNPKWMELPIWVVNLVNTLTRPSTISYPDYIENICDSRDALAVKIADMEDNLADNPTPKQLAKYNAALPVLKAALKNYAHKRKTI